MRVEWASLDQFLDFARSCCFFVRRVLVQSESIPNKEWLRGLYSAVVSWKPTDVSGNDLSPAYLHHNLFYSHGGAGCLKHLLSSSTNCELDKFIMAIVSTVLSWPFSTCRLGGRSGPRIHPCLRQILSLFQGATRSVRKYLPKYRIY